MAISYLGGSAEARMLRLREGITTLGINPAGGTTSGERKELAKLQKALYDGDAVAKVTGKVRIGDSHKIIDSIAGYKEALHKAVVNGNVGLLELLEAAEDTSITPLKKRNIASAFTEAVLKVAIAGAGVADDLSKTIGVDVGDMNGRLLQGIRKLEQERDTLAKEAKK